jgi:hypothetical protein
MDRGTSSFKRLIGMKTFPFRVSKWLWFGIPICLGIGILCACCKPLIRNDISGVYIRSYDGVVDTIVLNANGTFQQTITYKKEGPWIKSGSWELDWQVVHFDYLYYAFDYDSVKHKPFIVIPPEQFATATLWVEKDKLLKDPIFPIWFKQPKNK